MTSPVGLEQVCPKCGTREAAGYCCTACTRRTGPDDWRQTVRSDAQIAVSGANARRRAENRAASKKSGKTGPVAA